MLVHKFKGFSLIELIVVIGVIALLSTIILSGYNRTVQSYKLSILTDEFISQLQAVKANVRAKNEPLCRGLLVDQEGIFFVESDYLNPVQKCNQIPAKVTEFSDESLLIEDVTIDTREIDRFTYYYVPPHGEVFFPFETITDNSVIKMVLRLKNTEKEREVYFVPGTARFTDSNPALNE